VIELKSDAGEKFNDSILVEQQAWRLRRRERAANNELGISRQLLANQIRVEEIDLTASPN
jgi:hypothetical protein